MFQDKSEPTSNRGSQEGDSDCRSLVESTVEEVPTQNFQLITIPPIVINEGGSEQTDGGFNKRSQPLFH